MATSFPGRYAPQVNSLFLGEETANGRFLETSETNGAVFLSEKGSKRSTSLDQVKQERGMGTIHSSGAIDWRELLAKQTPSSYCNATKMLITNPRADISGPMADAKREYQLSEYTALEWGSMLVPHDDDAKGVCPNAAISYEKKGRENHIVAMSSTPDRLIGQCGYTASLQSTHVPHESTKVMEAHDHGANSQGENPVVTFADGPKVARSFHPAEADVSWRKVRTTRSPVATKKRAPPEAQYTEIATEFEKSILVSTNLDILAQLLPADVNQSAEVPDQGLENSIVNENSYDERIGPPGSTVEPIMKALDGVARPFHPNEAEVHWAERDSEMLSMDDAHANEDDAHANEDHAQCHEVEIQQCLSGTLTIGMDTKHANEGALWGMQVEQTRGHQHADPDSPFHVRVSSGAPFHGSTAVEDALSIWEVSIKDPSATRLVAQHNTTGTQPLDPGHPAPNMEYIRDYSRLFRKQGA